MAEKSFGIKELNLIGASGTPSIDSPNNLNLNAVNVAISTNVSIGGTLAVTGNVSVGGTLTYEDVTNIDSVGLITARNGLNVTAGVSTFAAEIHGNNQRLGSLSSSGRFNGLFLNDGTSYYGSNKLFVSSSSGFGLEAYSDMDAYLRSNRGGGTDGNCYMMTGSSSGGYVFVNGDNGVEIHHAGTSNKKFETTSSGATVTGTLTATTFSGSGASLTSLPAANLTGTLPAISGANLTNLPADTPTNSDIQVVYAVTANGASAYRFAGNGIVSTADNPDVYLTRGLKYRFINNSGGSHPFQIREASGGSAYSSGVTNNGAASGNIDFQVPYSAPSRLYYQCTAHGGMVGNLYIRGAGGNNTNVGVTTFSGGNVSIPSGSFSLNAAGTSRFEIASIENAEIDGDIAHSGDTDTKIAFGNNEIDFQAAGSSRLKVSQYAIYVQSGLPMAFLATSGATPNIKSGGTNAQDLLFTTGSGNPTRLQITSGGKVFIGSDSTDFSDAGTFFNLKHDTYGGRIGFSNATATAGVTLMEQLAYWGTNKVAGTVIVAGTDTTNKDDASMSFYTNNGSGMSERMKIDKNGAIEIKSTTGNDLLTLTPTSSASTSMIFNTWQDNSQGRNWAIRNRYSDHGRLEIMRSTANNNDPLTAVLSLYHNSNIGAPNGNNIYNASDERLKENMVELTDGLSKINQIKPYSFTWKSGFDKDLDGVTQYGFGAHQTKTVDEILVEPFGVGDVELNGETIENPLRVNEKHIIPLLVKAIQELSAEVAALKSS